MPHDHIVNVAFKKYAERQGDRAWTAGGECCTRYVKSKEVKNHMLASTLSSKGQVTLSKKVREKTGVRAGDRVVHQIKGNTATIPRVERFDVLFHTAVSGTLDEWSTKEDDEAFPDL